MTNVVKLTKPPSGIAGALAILDSLREAVQSGQIIAFAAVGVESSDTTRGWLATTQPFSNLRMRGAITALMQEVIDS